MSGATGMPSSIRKKKQDNNQSENNSQDENNNEQWVVGKCAANKQLEQRVLFTLQRIVADSAMAGAFRETDDSKLPGMNLAKQNVDAILQMTFEVFSETFADMAACTLLNARLEDYLLAFVFENWRLDESLVLSTDMIFRIGAILNLCFSNQLEGKRLKDEVKKSLFCGVETLERHGMVSNRIDAVKLIKRVEELLSGYCELHQESVSLEKYLKLCKQQYDDWSKIDTMQRYQHAFQNMRLYQFTAEDNCKKVIAMVEAVTTGG